MTHFAISVTGNTAQCLSRRGILTAGMTGASVSLTFDSPWEGLHITAVFRCGEKSVDVIPEGSTLAIPAGILLPDETLYFGLYGTDGEAVVIPTVWVALATVHPAADPSGDTAADPTLPIWAQFQARLEALEAVEAPVRGVDYWTESDKAEIKAYVEEAILGGAW